MAVRINRDVEDTVSHLPGVVQSVRSEAKDIETIARVLLSSHRRTGAAHIELTHRKPDSFVSLVDNTDQNTKAIPAVAIEYGHTDTRSGTYVPGLYIITRASGFA
ncbi:DUF5403 family protein [Actinopolyspora erythraea]|uniref:DUF5403 family protein n=1 Tax=Actinopolyspora erythraea TaxID=414996 RepID=UPI00178CF851